MAKALRAAAEVTIRGAEPWRFADRCVKESIPLWNVHALDDFTLGANLPLRELERSRRLAERCGCALALSSVSVVPRARGKLRRHRWLLAAFTGVLLAALVSSLFVWDVEVTENDSDIPDAEILRVLSAQGVGTGSFWPSFRGERIRTRALLALPELRFLAVNVRGSRAMVEVRAAIPPPEIFDPGQARDLMASRAGVIESIVTLAGEPLVARGDAVTEGQTLIAGTPALPHARGEGRAYTYYDLTATAPLSAEKKGSAGRNKRHFALILGDKRINFYWNSGILPPECDKITQVWNLEVKNLFSLPVQFLCEKIMSRSTEKMEVVVADVTADLKEALSDRLRGQLGPDGEVRATHWSVSADGEWVRVTLRAECLERIDTETPGE